MLAAFLVVRKLTLKTTKKQVYQSFSPIIMSLYQAGKRIYIYL